MSDKHHLVSCIIPVYNGERFLAEAIDSILSQTYKVTEIVVIDDGSTDGTPDVVRGYGNRLRYARQTNAGKSAARNHGIRLATGEFIAFLDADDLWHSEKLARQIDRFIARPELGYCLTHRQNFWVSERAGEAARLQDHRLTEAHPGTASTFIARTECFNLVGPLNDRLKNRDIQEWMLRADRLGVVREVMPDVLVSRRIHDSNESRQRRKEEWFDIIKQSLDSKRQNKSGK